MYYGMPMQVQYYCAGIYRKGIVFHEWIVDLDDGEPVKVDTVLQAALAHEVNEDDAIVEWCKWRSLV